MTIIEFASIRQPEQRVRDSFLAPSGTYYTTTFPDVETATDLVELGVIRIVSGADWREDLAEAMGILCDAGVEIDFRQVA